MNNQNNNNSSFLKPSFLKSQKATFRGSLSPLLAVLALVIIFQPQRGSSQIIESPARSEQKSTSTSTLQQQQKKNTSIKRQKKVSDETKEKKKPTPADLYCQHVDKIHAEALAQVTPPQFMDKIFEFANQLTEKVSLEEIELEAIKIPLDFETFQRWASREKHRKVPDHYKPQYIKKYRDYYCNGDSMYSATFGSEPEPEIEFKAKHQFDPKNHPYFDSMPTKASSASGVNYIPEPLSERNNFIKTETHPNSMEDDQSKTNPSSSGATGQ